MVTLPGRRPRLADAVVEEMAIEILSCSIGAGQLLPPEPQLCERFGVSRTVVREAVARLQNYGLIDVRHGVGTRVLGREHWNDLDPDLIHIRATAGLIGDLAEDLFEIRRMIEVEVAGNAAERRTPGQVRDLQQLLKQMRIHAGEAAAYIDLDLAFHETLFRADGNELLWKMMRPVNEIRRIGSVINITKDARVIPASIAGHEAILDAIGAQDVPAARQAMGLHLDEFARDLKSGLASGTRPRRAGNRYGNADG